MRPIYLLAIVFAATAATQEQPRIDYTTTGEALPKAVSAIAEQTGLKLRVDPEFSQEPIVLRLKDVPAQEALDRIAEVMGAEWVKDEDRQILTRPEALRNKLLAERRARRAEAIRDTLLALQKRRAEDRDFTDEEAKAVAEDYVRLTRNQEEGVPMPDYQQRRATLQARSAERRLLRDILLSLGPERLASLPEGINVFALEPTTMQRRLELPPERLAAYLDEHNRLARAFRQVPDLKLDEFLFTSAHQVETMEMPRILMTVGIGGPSDEFPARASLALYWPDSFLHAEEYLIEQVSPARWTEAFSKVKAAPKNERTIEFGPISRELSGRVFRQNSEPLGKATLDALTSPEKADPVSLGYGEAMVDIAKAEGLNLVARAEDQIAGTVVGLMNDTDLKAEGLFEYLRLFEMEVERRDGWLIHRHRDAVAPSRTRIDRSLLGEFARALAAKGSVPLDQRAQLAAASGLDSMPSAYHSYAGWLGFREPNNWLHLRFYGTLTREQRGALASGGRLPGNKLYPDQMRLLETAIFQRPVLLLRAGEELAAPVFEAQPTVALPEGVPLSLDLSLADTAEQALFGVIDGPRAGGFEQEMPLVRIAAYYVSTDYPDLVLPNEAAFRLKAVRLGTKRSLVLDALFDRGFRYEMRLSESTPGAEVLEPKALLERLPPDQGARLKEMIRLRVEALKKAKERESTTPVAAP